MDHVEMQGNNNLNELIQSAGRRIIKLAYKLE